MIIKSKTALDLISFFLTIKRNQYPLEEQEEEEVNFEYHFILQLSNF